MTTKTMQKLLASLEELSRLRQPKAAGVKLPKGLRILIKRDEKGAMLALARDGAWPSDLEWAIVLQNFPWYVPQITPTRKARGCRYFLMARIPDSKQPQLFEGQKE